MTTPISDSTPTSVYRYYDAVGALIYVGITKAGMGRQLQHNGDKEWWQWVASQQVDHFQTRWEAAAREQTLIRKYRPPFNTQHNPDHAEIRAAYLQARALGLYGDAAQPVGFLPKTASVMEFVVHDYDPVRLTATVLTRVQDAPAVSRLVFSDKGPSPKVTSIYTTKAGRVIDVQRMGPLAKIHLSLTPKCRAFTKARIKLIPTMGGKGLEYQIKTVHLEN